MLRIKVFFFLHRLYTRCNKYVYEKYLLKGQVRTVSAFLLSGRADPCWQEDGEEGRRRLHQNAALPFPPAAGY